MAARLKVATKTYLERARICFPGGANSSVRTFSSMEMQPLFAASSRGAYLSTTDGNTYIDCVGGWGPHIHGHSHPRIKAAVTVALDKGSTFGITCEKEMQLAELIIEHLPHVECLRFVNSGTEATATAIRLARGYTKRDKIIKFHGCYHGHHDAVLPMASIAALLVPEGHVLENDGLTQSTKRQDTLSLPFNNLEAVKQAFKDKPQEIAAVILEPYLGNLGLIFPKKGYLKELKKLCKAAGALLIFDEVMTGFRVGFQGVSGEEDVQADITVLGKIMGGGLPIGAIGASHALMDTLYPSGYVYQGGTFSGNILSMSAGLESLSLLLESEPYIQLNTATAALGAALLEEAKIKGLPLRFHHTHSMFWCHFSQEAVFDHLLAKKVDSSLYIAFFKQALKRGIFLPPAAFEAAFLSTAHTLPVLETLSEKLVAALRAL